MAKEMPISPQQKELHAAVGSLFELLVDQGIVKRSKAGAARRLFTEEVELAVVGEATAILAEVQGADEGESPLEPSQVGLASGATADLDELLFQSFERLEASLKTLAGSRFCAATGKDWDTVLSDLVMAARVTLGSVFEALCPQPHPSDSLLNKAEYGDPDEN